jgi:hypothetical protein
MKINSLIIVSLSIFVFSCKSGDKIRFQVQDKNAALTYYKDLPEILKEQIETTYFNFSNDKDTEIITKKGTHIFIQGNAFLDKEQNPVHYIKIQFSELDNRSGMLSAGMQTVSSSGLLESNGMFFINAYDQNDQQLYLKDNSSIGIETPVKEDATNYNIFRGSMGSNSSRITWIEPTQQDRYIIEIPRELLPEMRHIKKVTQLLKGYSNYSHDKYGSLCLDSEIIVSPEDIQFCNSLYQRLSKSSNLRHTYLNTREFDNRLKVLKYLTTYIGYHNIRGPYYDIWAKDGNNELGSLVFKVLDIYISYRDSDLYKADSVAASYIASVNAKITDSCFVVKQTFLNDFLGFYHQHLTKPINLDFPFDLSAPDAEQKLKKMNLSDSDIATILFVFRKRELICRQLVKDTTYKSAGQNLNSKVYACFEMQRLGWYNIDRSMEVGKEVTIKAAVSQLNSYDYVNTTLILSDKINCFVKGFRASTDTVYFGNSESTFKVPRDCHPVIVVVGIKNGEMFWGRKTISFSRGGLFDGRISLAKILNTSLKDSLMIGS